MPRDTSDMSSSIHVFSLPPDLLQNITLRSLLSQKSTGVSDQEHLSSLLQTAPISGARACNICLGATFLDVEEQRTHFRSDWHRYNVKVRLRGGNPISEVDFAKLVDSKSPVLRLARPCVRLHIPRPRRFDIWFC